jgi:serine/threonine protein kinase
MANMHESGYVHRDFKPTKIIFQQTSMQFVCVGFSSAECIGGTRPHSYALTYAAPEVVQFTEEHSGESKAMSASTAMDSWSMGMIAIELLTGGPALDVETFGLEGVRFFPCPVHPNAHRGARYQLASSLKMLSIVFAGRLLGCLIVNL